MRVLIVDDSEAVVETLGDALKQILPTAEIYAAPDVASAVKLLPQARPDVAFVDMLLAHGPTGVNLLPALAKQGHRCSAVLLTGLPPEHPEVVTALSLGAFGYLRKPVRRASLVEMLKEIETETRPAERPLGRLGS